MFDLSNEDWDMSNIYSLQYKKWTREEYMITRDAVEHFVNINNINREGKRKV